MDMRKLIRTKTFWAGVASICAGVAMILHGQQEQGAQTIILGVLAITGRDALAKM